MPPRKGMKYLKKNCDGCLGLENGLCIFHIPIEHLIDATTGNTTIKPMLPCSKPKTRQKLNGALTARTSDSKGNPPYRTP